MASEILVNLEIPFPSGGTFLVFHRWLPSKEDSILIERDDSLVRLWIDPSCTWLTKEALERIDRHVNVHVAKIYIDVIIRNVADELVEFMYEEKDRPKRGPEGDPDDRYTRLRQEYRELGKLVLELALSAYNRFVAYARILKGQYWLYQRPIGFDRMASDFTEFHARVKTEGRGWIRWFPASEVTITLTAQDPARFISQEDWFQAVEFIQSEGRPNLVLELLSNAESLANEGFRRSAIIEAVAALEVATIRFSKSPRFDDLIGTESASRVDAQSFSSQVEHLGFSATLRYLFPILFSEQAFPLELLHDCQRAIEIRGNVVHRGQRDVDNEILQPLLGAIRKACNILAEFTEGA